MERAKARQRYVLQQLVNGKKISREDAERAYKEAITVYRAESPNATVAPYFFFEVKKQLENALNIPDLTSGGYEVHTTLDMQLQRQAVSAVHEAMKEHEGRKGFRGPLKRHGEKHKDILKNIVSLPLSDGKLERAVVVDIIPALDAAAIVSQRGLGLLLLEDHRWALRTSRSKGSSVLDFADILRVGDEINVQLLERGSPSRIVQNSNLLSYLSSYLTYYPAEPANKGVRYYGLTDTEGVEAAALVMNATNGEVLAMVGGTSFENSQFNRTTQAKRQVGSSVKSLYYALAFDHGFSPASQIDSPPIVIGDWKPENYDREFLGRTTLRKSFIHSYNIPSIQLLQAVGADVCATHFKKLGFDWPESDFSIALGAGDATLLQMTQAYSPFANEGRLSEAVYITKILDRHGKVLFDKSKNDLRVMPVAYQEPRATQKQTQRQRLNAKAATREALFQSDDPKQVLSPQAAFLGVRIMQDVVRFGTGTRANATSHAAGKTGTTNAYTDAWFMGVVPNLVGGVWVGYDDARKSLGANGTGGRMAAPIWREVMKAAAALYPAPGWKEPSGITNIRVDADTGQPIFGAGGIVVPVVTGTEPGSPRARNALGLLASDSADDTGTGTEEAPDLRSVF